MVKITPSKVFTIQGIISLVFLNLREMPCNKLMTNQMKRPQQRQNLQLNILSFVMAIFVCRDAMNRVS